MPGAGGPPHPRPTSPRGDRVDPAELLDCLLERARYVPGEAAGWLLQDAGGLRATCQAGSAGRFVLDPLELAAAEDAGQALVGVWHSHPGGPPVPSLADHAAARAWPGTLWLILGLAPAPRLAAFRATADGLVPEARSPGSGVLSSAAP